MNRCIRITKITMLAMLLAFGNCLAADKTATEPPERSPETLTKFDLDFKGGTPKDLITAVEKAIGRAVNALIPDEYANVIIPGLKMKNVNTAQLFQALEQASRRTEYLQTGNGSYGSYGSGYGFRANSDKITDDTIWYFHLEKPHIPPPYKACKFYFLGPYLDSGISIDDITTAIKTGSKMLGEADEPTMSFHKDTKLLIAVGQPGKLEIIDSVLKALEPRLTSPVAEKPAAAKTGEKSGEEK